MHEACPLLGFRRLSVIWESLQLLEEIALDCWLCAILLLLSSCYICQDFNKGFVEVVRLEIPYRYRLYRPKAYFYRITEIVISL